MQRIRRSLLGGSLLWALALVWVATAASAVVNKIVLRVNDRIVTTYDYQSRRAERLQALERSNLPPEQQQQVLARIGEDIMSDLFEELLILSRADQLGVEPSSVEIDEAVQRAKESFGIETEADFQRALAQSGLDLDGLREQMRRNLMIQEVMGREVQPRIELEEEDLRRYYQANSDDFRESERLKLREVIVLEASGASPERLSEVAGEVRQRIAGGEEMAEVVAPWIDEGLTTKPIDLGWVEAGDLDRQLEEAVWGLGVGEISAPVVARGGLHLIQLTERQEARILPFTEVAQQIESAERDRRFQEEVSQYLEELEGRAYVVASPPPEAAGFRSTLSGRADDPLEAADPLGPTLGATQSTEEASETTEEAETGETEASTDGSSRR